MSSLWDWALDTENMSFSGHQVCDEAPSNSAWGWQASALCDGGGCTGSACRQLQGRQGTALGDCDGCTGLLAAKPCGQLAWTDACCRACLTLYSCRGSRHALYDSAFLAGYIPKVTPSCVAWPAPCGQQIFCVTQMPHCLFVCQQVWLCWRLLRRSSCRRMLRKWDTTCCSSLDPCKRYVFDACLLTSPVCKFRVLV